MRAVIAVVLAVLICLSATSLAAAQSTVNGYNDDAGQVQTQIGGESTGTTSGGLPFTGLDLLLLVGAGAVLGGTGLAMRRLARESRAC